MARPRRPTPFLAISGGLDKNPQRYADRAAEPVDERELGDPPPKLDASAAAVWREIAQLAPPGVLAQADRLIVELASVLVAQFRLQGTLMPLPAVTRLQSVLGDLGMTPASRSRVTSTASPKLSSGKFANIGRRPDPPGKPGRKAP